MPELWELVEGLRDIPGCAIRPPTGQPSLPSGLGLPPDVVELYRLSGGLTLFEASNYRIDIVAPDGFVAANPILAGVTDTGDISDRWFIVATCGSPSAALTIDLDPERLGRCYDSFWDCHAIAGSSAVVAHLFTELLSRIIENRGDYWFWMQPEFEPLGDAYD